MESNQDRTRPHSATLIIGLAKLAVLAVYGVLAATVNPTSNRAIPATLDAVVLLLLTASMGLVFTRNFRSLPAPVRAAMVWADIATFVLAFSTGYLLLSGHVGELEGIRTRIDAFYFTSTTLTTVGFGDIKAVGQWARSLVTIQMLFGFTYLATILTSVAATTRGAEDDR